MAKSTTNNASTQALTPTEYAEKQARRAFLCTTPRPIPYNRIYDSTIMGYQSLQREWDTRFPPPAGRPDQPGGIIRAEDNPLPKYRLLHAAWPDDPETGQPVEYIEARLIDWDVTNLPITEEDAAERERVNQAAEEAHDEEINRRNEVVADTNAAAEEYQARNPPSPERQYNPYPPSSSSPYKPKPGSQLRPRRVSPHILHRRRDKRSTSDILGTNSGGHAPAYRHTVVAQPQLRRQEKAAQRIKDSFQKDEPIPAHPMKEYIADYSEITELEIYDTIYRLPTTILVSAADPARRSPRPLPPSLADKYGEFYRHLNAFALTLSDISSGKYGNREELALKLGIVEDDINLRPQQIYAALKRFEHRLHIILGNTKLRYGKHYNPNEGDTSDATTYGITEMWIILLDDNELLSLDSRYTDEELIEYMTACFPSMRERTSEGRMRPTLTTFAVQKLRCLYNNGLLKPQQGIRPDNKSSRYIIDPINGQRLPATARGFPNKKHPDYIRITKSTLVKPKLERSRPHKGRRPRFLKSLTVPTPLEAALLPENAAAFKQPAVSQEVDWSEQWSS